MELQEVLNSRRSMRSYDAEKKVTKEQLETIINAAILAPSWKNLQTSRYYCILSDDKIEEFRHKCLPEFNQNAGSFSYCSWIWNKGCADA